MLEKGNSNSSESKYQFIYGESIFNGYKDKITPAVIDFESTDISLIHPKIILRKNMRAKDVKEIFPETFKLIKVSGNVWSGYVELFVSDKNFDMRKWFLVFQTEELKKVILYDVPVSW